MVLCADVALFVKVYDSLIVVYVLAIKRLPFSLM